MFLNMILFYDRNREYTNIERRLIIIIKCQTICCFRFNYSNTRTRQKNKIEGWLDSSTILDLKVPYVPTKNGRKKDEAAQITYVRGKDIMRMITWQKIPWKNHIYIYTRAKWLIFLFNVYIEQGDGSLANEYNKLRSFFFSFSFVVIILSNNNTKIKYTFCILSY